MIDNFVGSTFQTPKGSTLTVIAWNGERRDNLEKLYTIECSVCSNDREMYPLILRPKHYLMKGFVPCMCSNHPILDERQIGILIKRGVYDKESKKGGVIHPVEQIRKGRLLIGFICECSICSKDAELFPYGSITTGKGDLEIGQIPCGCSVATKWSDRQYEILLSRACEGSDLTFNHIVNSDDRKGSKRRISLTCKYHGEFSTVTMVNLLSHGRGCSKCSGNFRHSRDYYITEANKQTKGKYNFNLAPEMVRASTIFNAVCPSHGKFKTNFNRIKTGNTCPQCSGKSQNVAYINTVADSCGVVAVKFGIATNTPTCRVRVQNRKSALTIKNMLSYFFSDTQKCKEAENEVKKSMKCGIISRFDMTDGFSETTSVNNISKIIEIYEKHGGIKQ